MAVGNGYSVTNTLGLNNPYDPIGGGGRQPTGWDQWIALYNEAVCYKTTYTATFFLTDVTATSDYCNVELMPTKDAVETTAWAAMALQARFANPAESWKTIVGISGPQRKVTMRRKFNWRRFYKQGIFTDDEFVCTSASGPAQAMQFNQRISNQITSDMTVQVFAMVHFYVLFRQPRPIADA